jgi:chemotaxis protein methyltransferase CheR
MFKPSDTQLLNLSSVIDETIGLSFSPERFVDLERGIKKSAGEFGFSNYESFINWLLKNKPNGEQIQILASNLTVGETYFFRDIFNLEILKKDILPSILKDKKANTQQLKIWCAGCSSGEEPYSVAIWLKNMEKELKGINVSITATDINKVALDKAREGRYTEWSFRSTPEPIKARYFSKDKTKGFLINKEIKEMVNFFYLNLAESSYPSILNKINSIDIIFCRNVLMYFSKPQMKKVIERFYKTLVNNGWLIVGSVETSQELFPDFLTVNFKDAVFYQKEKKQEQETLDSYLLEKIPDLKANLPPDNFNIEKTKENITEKVEINSEKLEGALTFFTKNQYEQAEKILLEIFAGLKNVNTNDHLIVRGISLLIKIYANSRRIEEALLWCETGISTNRLEPVFHYLQASVLLEQGKLSEAKKSLNKILYLDQDFILAHFVLGNLYRQQEKHQEAGKHFQRALLLLEKLNNDEIVPESDEMTAGQLIEIIRMIVGSQ